MSSDKTEPPTEKKLEDARRDGQSAKSQDLTAAGALLGATTLLWVSAGAVYDRISGLFSFVWVHLPRRDEQLGPLIMTIVQELLLLSLPFALGVAICAALSLVLQGAATMSFKPVSLKPEAVNPAAGLKRIFSMRSAIDAGMTLVKGVSLGAILWFVWKGILPLLVNSTARSPAFLGNLLWQVLIRLLFTGAAFFVVVGIVDYGLQKFLFLRDRRMSKDEVKRQHKENNGNPEVKQTRKSLAQELLFSDPKEAVVSSKMVVANPTHYAVAIGYEKGALPWIKAKGLDEVAISLRTTAERAGIPVFVNPALARALHASQVGNAVPRESLYLVGLMLHWVERLSNASARANDPEHELPS